MPEYQRTQVRVLRQAQTESEERLWSYLRGRQLDGLKFRRQRPLGRFVADFCCDDLKLVLEIDGSVHDLPDRMQYDEARSEEIARYGYTVLRIRACDVMKETDRVLTAISRYARTYRNGSPSPADQGEGDGG